MCCLFICLFVYLFGFVFALLSYYLLYRKRTAKTLASRILPTLLLVTLLLFSFWYSTSIPCSTLHTYISKAEYSSTLSSPCDANAMRCDAM